MKRRLLEIFIQIIPVMIGVYLGFAVSNWSDTRKTEKQKKVFIENVSSEINSNKQKIEAVVSYHQMLRDSCNYYSYGKDIKEMKPEFFKGVLVEPLLNSVFKTGNQTGIINELPTNLLQELNKIYTYQEYYDEYGIIVLDGIINMDFEENEKNLRQIARFLGITMTDIVIREENLIEMYKKMEKEIKPSANK